MTWKYAITKEGSNEDPYYTVREVHFTDSGEVTHWTTDPVTADGESSLSVRDTLQMMSRDAEKGQVLDLTVDPPVWIDES